jgi:hypothetical protein
MSVAGISSSFSITDFKQQQNQIQQFRQEVQQLGQDLQGGNLSAAQSDFTQLQQLTGQQNSSQISSPVAQAFTQLGHDLQSGNLTAAQQDFNTITQDVQNAVSQSQGHHHHHHHGGGGGQSNPVQDAIQQLGQDLQAGNLSAAQQAYSSIQQDFQNFASGSASSNPALAGSVNATA